MNMPTDNSSLDTPYAHPNWADAPLEAVDMAATEQEPSTTSQTLETLVESLDFDTPGMYADVTSPTSRHAPEASTSAVPEIGSNFLEDVTEVTDAASSSFGQAPRLLHVDLSHSAAAHDSQQPSPGHTSPAVLASEAKPTTAPEQAETEATQQQQEKQKNTDAAHPGPMYPRALDLGSWCGSSMESDHASGPKAGTQELEKPSPTVDNDIVQRQDSNQSTISTLGKSLRRASEHFKIILVGDDQDVQDKWDNYDDDVEEEIEVVKRGLSMTRRSRSGRSMSRPGHSKVHAASASQGSYSTDGGLSMDSHSPPQDVVSEKRASRTLIWYYFQTCLFSMLVTAVCVPLVALMSTVKWHTETEAGTDDDTRLLDLTFTAADKSGPDALPLLSGIRPNHTALQWMLLVQIVLPLCVYAVLLYACIRRSFRLPRPMIALVAFTVAWATLVCGLFYKFDLPFWFYYGDLFLIVAAYVPCMCMVGWYVDIDDNAPVRQRLMDVAVTALLETIVAASTLVYCFFIMPLFFTLTSAWMQMLWLCVLHPLYFEATTGFVVRKVLQRNRRLGRNHILYLLSIVHSMVHVVVLGTSLQASIEPIRILVPTVLLYNLAKLTWRSTVIQRDLFVERLFQGWSFAYSVEELAELSRMVSVGIITEIILENASIFIAPFMMFRMYKEPLFMAVVPNSFFDNEGTYPVSTLITLIALLFTFTVLFDLIFYFLNYHWVQHLPLINTWRRIKRSQGWYLMFLIYAFAAMGVLFLFLTMMILPRAAYCRSDNYCDCSTLAYSTICEGNYISTLVDYLVTP